MRAKLIRVIPEEEGLPFYFRQYEYECIECGSHYTRHQYNDRICPYCGPCSNKHDRIRQKERRETKDREKINRVLDEIKGEIQELRGCSCGCSDGIIDEVEDILDKHISGKE